MKNEFALIIMNKRNAGDGKTVGEEGRSLRRRTKMSGYCRRIKS